MSSPIDGTAAYGSRMDGSFVLIKKNFLRILPIDFLSFAASVMKATITVRINCTPPKSAKTKRNM
jgi:hypothetical protein